MNAQKEIRFVLRCEGSPFLERNETIGITCHQDSVAFSREYITKFFQRY